VSLGTPGRTKRSRRQPDRAPGRTSRSGTESFGTPRRTKRSRRQLAGAPGRTTRSRREPFEAPRGTARSGREPLREAPRTVSPALDRPRMQVKAQASPVAARARPSRQSPRVQPQGHRRSPPGLRAGRSTRTFRPDGFGREDGPGADRQAAPSGMDAGRKARERGRPRRFRPRATAEGLRARGRVSGRARRKAEGRSKQSTQHLAMWVPVKRTLC
jgi:hypothetical protein